MNSVLGFRSGKRSFALLAGLAIYVFGVGLEHVLWVYGRERRPVGVLRFLKVGRSEGFDSVPMSPDRILQTEDLGHGFVCCRTPARVLGRRRRARLLHGLLRLRRYYRDAVRRGNPETLCGRTVPLGWPAFDRVDRPSRAGQRGRTQERGGDGAHRKSPRHRHSPPLRKRASAIPNPCVGSAWHARQLETAPILVAIICRLRAHGGKACRCSRTTGSLIERCRDTIAAKHAAMPPAPGHSRRSQPMRVMVGVRGTIASNRQLRERPLLRAIRPLPG